MISNMNRWSVVWLLMSPLIAILFLNGLYLKYLSVNSGWYWLNEFVTWLAIPLGTLYALHIRCGVSSYEYGLRWPRSRKEKHDLVPQALTLLMFSFFNEFVLYSYLPQLYFIPEPFSYGQALQLQGFSKWGIALFFALSAGLVESIFFLGLLEKVVFNNSSQLNKSVAFVTVSTVLFASIHWEQGSRGVISAAIFGAVYAWLYLRIKYLLPFILAHVVLDFAVYL